MTLEQYRADWRVRWAVERGVQIVTEAVIRLEDSGNADRFPEIAWREYRGMGNVLRHAYHRIDDETVWLTIHEDLPALKRVVEEALDS